MSAVAPREPRRVAYEVIVVLNNARQRVEDAVRQTVQVPGVIESAVNLGFAGGCNLGASVARGEYLVLLNDDAIVEPGWLDWLVQTADANARRGCGRQLRVVSGRADSGSGLRDLERRLDDACRPERVRTASR